MVSIFLYPNCGQFLKIGGLGIVPVFMPVSTLIPLPLGLAGFAKTPVVAPTEVGFVVPRGQFSLSALLRPFGASPCALFFDFLNFVGTPRLGISNEVSQK
jgi:hypothetical protein